MVAVPKNGDIHLYKCVSKLPINCPTHLKKILGVKTGEPLSTSFINDLIEDMTISPSANIVNVNEVLI